MSPAWLQIGDPNPSRLAAALSFIVDGRSVDFGGFSLAVLDGILYVGVDYPTTLKDEDRAATVIQDAKSRVNALLETEPDFARFLATLPRHYSLVYSYGTGDVEVGWMSGNDMEWR